MHSLGSGAKDELELLVKAQNDLPLRGLSVYREVTLEGCPESAPLSGKR